MAPVTPIENEVAQVWQAVLNVERIGLHDNYFELGGHSLLATRILSRLRAMYGIELTLQTLFEAPSVGELAQSITAMMAGQEDEADLLALMAEVQGLAAAEVAELLT
ncbi:MAG: phosphopantetheine-binding protein [Caldilineaceae bacterium]